MNFICRACKSAADLQWAANDLDEAARWRVRVHEKCKGHTWCDCQHKVRR